MKHILLFTLLLFTSQTLLSQEVIQIEDENMLHQIQFQYDPSQTADILTPAFWYRWWDNNYINNYKPNYTRTTFMSAYTSVSKRSVETEEKMLDSLTKQKLIEFANRTIDIAYITVSDEVEHLKNVFQIYHDSIMNSDVEKATEMADGLQELFDSSLDKINAIKRTHIENNIRKDEYNNYVKEMDTIARETKTLWNCIKIYKKRAIFNF